MKISEFIVTLNDCKRRYGDINVCLLHEDRKPGEIGGMDIASLIAAGFDDERKNAKYLIIVDSNGLRFLRSLTDDFTTRNIKIDW